MDNRLAVRHGLVHRVIKEKVEASQRRREWQEERERPAGENGLCLQNLRKEVWFV